jgi:hypothetical protein
MPKPGAEEDGIAGRYVKCIVTVHLHHMNPT